MAGGATTGHLPPSVEEAYRRKCVEMKKRIADTEEANEGYRIRKIRLLRGIRKMRLERAYLLECLGARMRKNQEDPDSELRVDVEHQARAWDDESEGSSDAPPTPEEKPLRSKRSARRSTAAASSPPQSAVDSQDARSAAKSSSSRRKSAVNGQSAESKPLTQAQQLHPSDRPARESFDPKDAFVTPATQSFKDPTIPSPMAFALFFEQQYLSSDPAKHYRGKTEDDMYDIALEDWQNPAFADERARYEKELERRQQEAQRFAGGSGDTPAPAEPEKPATPEAPAPAKSEKEDIEMGNAGPTNA